MFKYVLNAVIVLPLLISFPAFATFTSGYLSGEEINMEELYGAWQWENTIYIFDKDGLFYTVDDSPTSGNTWSILDDELVLSFLDSPLNPPHEEKFKFAAFRNDRLILEDIQGAQFLFTRPEQEIISLSGELFFLERIALPPEITVRIDITQNGGTKFVHSSLHTRNSEVPITFRAYYQENIIDVDSPLEISAIIYYKENAIFHTEEATVVDNTVQELAPIRLYRSEPEEVSIQELAPPLAYSFISEVSDVYYASQLYLEDEHLFFLVQQSISEDVEAEYISWGHWNQVDRGHSIELLMSGKDPLLGAITSENSLSFNTLPNIENISPVVLEQVHSGGEATRSFSIFGIAEKIDNNYYFQPCGLTNSYALIADEENMPMLETLFEENSATSIHMKAQFSRSEGFILQDLLHSDVETTCPQSDSSSSLTNTYWRLTSLRGNPPSDFADSELHLILRPTEESTTEGEGGGSDGCNSFFITWTEQENNALDIAFGGTTMRMCTPEIEAQASAYMQTLDAIDNYIIRGSVLKLRAGEESLATFEAVEL